LFNLCLCVKWDSLPCSFTSIISLLNILLWLWNVQQQLKHCSFEGGGNKLVLKGPYGCKWTWETIHRYTKKQIKIKEQCFNCCCTFHSHSKVFRKIYVLGVSILPLFYDFGTVSKWVIFLFFILYANYWRLYSDYEIIDVNEHGKLSNFTRRHKLK
jgi:hypothetical protein